MTPTRISRPLRRPLPWPARLPRGGSLADDAWWARHRAVTAFRAALPAKVWLTRSALTGVEALVRWDHPQRGLLPPAVFIPAAEHTALIGPLTRRSSSRRPSTRRSSAR